jgi:cell division septation protein DedD
VAEGETQYNIPVSSKQLIVYFVFLVIALSAAFLAGVMVGRNVDSSPEPTVRDIQDGLPEDLTASPTPDALTYGSSLQRDKVEGLSPASGAATPVVSARAAATPLSALPAPSAKASPSVASARPVAEPSKQVPPLAPPTTKPKPTPSPAPAPKSATATAAPKATPGSGAKPVATPLSRLTIQVGAFKERAAAEAIVKRLKGKGYSAYLAPVSEGLFNVRVGSFTEREDAERVLAKLETQEKFKPFIVKP